MKIPVNNVKKETSLTDLYLFYRYKPYPKNNTIPKPYYPKSEYTNHQFSLSLPEWRKIVLTYFNNINLLLLNNKSFQPNFLIGTFSLHKYKKKNVYQRYNINSETLKYSWKNTCPFLHWDKFSNYNNLEFSKNFQIKLSEKFNTLIHNNLKDNPDFLDSFTELKFKGKYKIKI